MAGPAHARRAPAARRRAPPSAQPRARRERRGQAREPRPAGRAPTSGCRARRGARSARDVVPAPPMPSTGVGRSPLMTDSRERTSRVSRENVRRRRTRARASRGRRVEQHGEEPEHGAVVRRVGADRREVDVARVEPRAVVRRRRRSSGSAGKPAIVTSQNLSHVPPAPASRSPARAARRRRARRWRARTGRAARGTPRARARRRTGSGTAARPRRAGSARRLAAWSSRASTHPGWSPGTTAARARAPPPAREHHGARARRANTWMPRRRATGSLSWPPAATTRPCGQARAEREVVREVVVARQVDRRLAAAAAAAERARALASASTVERAHMGEWHVPLHAWTSSGAELRASSHSSAARVELARLEQAEARVGLEVLHSRARERAARSAERAALRRPRGARSAAARGSPPRSTPARASHADTANVARARSVVSMSRTLNLSNYAASRHTWS